MFRLSLLLCLSVVINSSLASKVAVILKDPHTLVLNVEDDGLNEGWFYGVSAKILTPNGENVIGKTKSRELTLHSPENLEKGFKVMYTLMWFDQLEVRPEEGSFSFNFDNQDVKSRRKRDFEDVESRFGYHGHHPKPRRHGIGYFPKHQNFPVHGPPPFLPTNDFGHHHHSWDHFNPCRDKSFGSGGANDLSSSGEKRFGSSEEKRPSIGSWEGFGNNNNNNNKPKKDLFTPNTHKTVIDTSTPETSTFPQIDIRFKKDSIEK